MNNPVFHLSGVVHERNGYEDFEGPLSLILQLLSKNKIEIKDISVSLILDQYLDYLHQMEKMDLEIASEFVAMASHLAYIKSKMLIVPVGEEISELDELIEGLEKLKYRDTYDRIKRITDTFAALYKNGAGLCVKAAESLPIKKEYPYFHKPEQLMTLLSNMLSRDDFEAKINAKLAEHYPHRVTFPVSVKADEINEKLRQFGTISLNKLFQECRSKSEMIAVFVSVLEMCKSGTVLLSGEENDMTLCRTDSAAVIDYAQYEDGV